MRRTTIPHSDKAFIHNQGAARPLSQPIETISPSEDTLNTRIKGILQCALGALCWGASGIAGQYLLVNRDISPEWLTFCRLLSAGVLLLFIFSLTGQTGIWSIWQNKKDRIRILVFGMLGMIWTQYGYFAAIKYSNAPTATVLEYLMPILIIFWYCLSERRLPHLVEIFCTVFAFVGTALIAGISFLPFMGLFPFTGAVDLSVGLAFLFVVIVGTICSFVLYLGSTKYISPADASIIAALEPLSSILLAFAVFGQDFGSFELLGMALIIAAVGVVSVHQ